MQRVIVENGKTIYIDLTPEEETARLLEIEESRPTPEETARLEAIREAPGVARAWFDSRPNAKLLFSLSITDLEIEINSLVDALFPLATAPNRTRLKILLMALAVSIRILVKRERLDS